MHDAAASVIATQAKQHSQSALNYLTRAVSRGQEIDPSFPAPAEYYENLAVLYSHEHKASVREPSNADAHDARNSCQKDETCLSMSSKYDLSLINQKFTLFVQTAKLQCLELPKFLNKRQSRKVKNLAYFYGIEARNCGRCGLTLFKTAHPRLPDAHGLPKITQMLLDEPKKGKGKTLAQNKQRQQKGNQKHSVRCIKQKPVIATNAGPTQTCTEVSTMPIDEGNVGNKMLRSMGWSTGTGLGLMAQGQVEPVPVVKRLKRRGLGA